MRIKLYPVAIVGLALVLIMSSCRQAPAKNSLRPRAYKAAIADKKDEILIDVRTPGEFKESHLAGAINMNWYDDSQFAADAEKMDKTKPVFLYCRSGDRSGQAAQAMRSMGFKEVYDLHGGMNAWKDEGLKIETEEDSRLKGLNTEEYHKLLETDKLVLVDFYATWCTPCKKMAPFLQEIAADKADKLILYKIDSDKNDAITTYLQISSLPTILLYKSQKLVWSHIGYIDKDALLKKLSTFE